MLEHLTTEYGRSKKAIKKRLREFSDVWRLPDEKIFAELCFCICTPQSRAVYCDRAIKDLEKSGALFSGGVDEIRASLKAVRFPNNKARYIREARDIFSSGGRLEIKKNVDVSDIASTREFFVTSVKGIGYKEASHFLRNIGHGSDLAILDVHIMKNMLRYGLLDKVPSCVSRSCYMELEKKLGKFSREIGIPLAELDILFWSMETGIIFK